jgi:hypothetical protein
MINIQHTKKVTRVKLRLKLTYKSTSTIEKCKALAFVTIQGIQVARSFTIYVDSFFPLIVKFLVRRDGNFFSTKCRHIREINWILKHNFEFSSIEAINIFMKNYILNVIGTTMCVSATIETALYRGTSLIGLVGTNVEAENIDPVVDWFGRHMTSWYIVCYRVWLVTCFHSCLRCQMQQATVWLQRVWLYVCKTSVWLTVWTSRARPREHRTFEEKCYIPPSTNSINNYVPTFIQDGLREFINL